MAKATDITTIRKMSAIVLSVSIECIYGSIIEKRTKENPMVKKRNLEEIYSMSTFDATNLNCKTKRWWSCAQKRHKMVIQTSKVILTFEILFLATLGNWESSFQQHSECCRQFVPGELRRVGIRYHGNVDLRVLYIHNNTKMKWIVNSVIIVIIILLWHYYTPVYIFFKLLSSTVARNQNAVSPSLISNWSVHTVQY